MFRSIYFRLSVLFFLLTLNLGILTAFFTSRSTFTFTLDAKQRLYTAEIKNISKKLVSEIQSNPSSNISTILSTWVFANPEAELYLLNSQGKIVATSAKQKSSLIDKIPIEEIKRYRDSSPANFPILGIDPKYPNSPKPFVVTPLEINGEPHFLYMTIVSEQILKQSDSIVIFYRAKIYAVMLGLGVLLTTSVTIVTFLFLTRKFRIMTEKVGAFAAGNLKERIKFKEDDELNELGMVFNSMADIIERNIEALKNTDSLRRELLANLSHDLRTPLTSISGYVEILHKNSGLGEEKKQRCIETIYQSTKSLERLISQLFELSSLEAKEKDLSLEPVFIQHLVERVYHQLKRSIDDKQIQLNMEFEQDLPAVLIDSSTMERAFSNLIGNAIRYCPNASQITVTGKLQDRGVRVTISDNGPGIAEEELSKVFERYYQARHASRTKNIGTGLGLTIVKKILERHGADIVIKNLSEGGFSVSFILPVAKNKLLVNTKPKLIGE